MSDYLWQLYDEQMNCSDGKQFIMILTSVKLQKCMPISHDYVSLIECLLLKGLAGWEA